MTTSSDGYLTATADNTTRSVLLSVNFSAIVPAPTVNLAAQPNNELGTVALAALANSTLAAISDAGVAPGSWVTRQQVTAAATSTARTVESYPVSPGRWYTGSGFNKSLVTARNVQVAVAWYTAAGTYISTSTIGTAVTGSIAAYVRPWCSAQAPATAYLAKIEVTVVGGAAGNQSYWDGWQFERATANATTSQPTLYCDGNQTGCAWTGTANNSMSYRPGYNKVTVYRFAGSSVSTVVRGSDGAVAPGGIYAKGIDHEAPLGVLLTYQASVTNGIATILSTTATATLAAQTTTAVLKSIRNPALSVALNVQQWPDWATPIPFAILSPLGSRYPNVSAGLRQAESGTLTVVTTTAAERAALAALLDSDGPFMLQGTPASGEADRYVFVGSVSYNRVTRVAAETYRSVDLPLTVVARPSTAGSRVAVPGHTYADSKVAWPLYSNRTGAYGTR